MGSYFLLGVCRLCGGLFYFRCWLLVLFFLFSWSVSRELQLFRKPTLGCFNDFYYIFFSVSLILALHFLLFTLTGLVLLEWEDWQGWKAERRVFQAGTKSKQSVGARSERDEREPQQRARPFSMGGPRCSPPPPIPLRRCLPLPQPRHTPPPINSSRNSVVIPENKGPGHISGLQTISTRARGTEEGTNM